MEKVEISFDYTIRLGDEQADAAVEELLTSAPVEELIQLTLRQIGITQPVMLTLVVTNDAEMQELNRQYRQQDKPTDVLSFPLLDEPLVSAPAEQLWQPAESEAEEEGEDDEGDELPAFITPEELALNLGDIVISWPTVVRQAETGGHSAAYEFLYLLTHGVLHLAGYDDQTEAGYSEMVRLQETILTSSAIGKQGA